MKPVKLSPLSYSRNDMYFHTHLPDYFDKLVEESPFSQEYWAKGQLHQRKLYEEGAIFKPLLDQTDDLPEKEVLLIKGFYDSVFPDDQLYQYLKSRPHSKLAVFSNSSHFAHLEEPKLFALQVKKFIMGD